MRSPRMVLLLMSPESPRRVLLIWDIGKPTCQRLSVATSCLAMTSWQNHLQCSALWLTLSDAQRYSFAQPGPGSLLSLSYLQEQIAQALKTQVYTSCPHLPQRCVGGRGGGRYRTQHPHIGLMVSVLWAEVEGEASVDTLAPLLGRCSLLDERLRTCVWLS